MAHQSFGIVVVSYRSAQEVEALARSLPAALAARVDELCVVDNTEEAEDLAEVGAVLAHKGVRLTVLRPGANIGFGAANNLGLAHLAATGCELVWFLNPDTRVADADPDRLDRELRAQPAPVLLATGLRTPSGRRAGTSVLSLRTGRVVHGAPSGGRVTFVNGNSMLARVPGLLALGGFDERFFLYFEEADLALRSAAAGMPLGVVEGLSVTHEGGGSTGSRRGERRSRVTVHHANRSCVLFFAKHRPARLPLVLAARAANCARLLVGDPRVAGAATAGLLAGVAALVHRAPGERMGR
ncbi:hypothetical protein Q760_15390 [Cellulomonas cellasea DSM 20118]|uniref:Glycosyltransferase 2-like domain-containing protein n=1 Tax=Cellulomonas cellasea DSM 20118 TaxID=1408250 RepID=A0A0A0B8H2_9CELL|nr:hypothetical protein Q760_15390 [Cellulomonas cellasea DSM 20118]